MCLASSYERRIITAILDGYDVRTRPVFNHIQPILVKMDINILRVVEMTWVDEFLTWDPAEYNGIEKLLLPATDVWLPDIAFYNDLGKGEAFKASGNSVVVYHNGTVSIYWRPFIPTTQCPVDVYSYPRDTQKCEFFIGSWSYTRDEVILEPISDTLNKKTFSQSGEWEMEETKIREIVIGSPIYYSCLEVTFSVSRKSTLYVITLILPSALMAVLSMFSLPIPHEFGNVKILMGVTLFLSSVVFLALAGERLPATTDKIPSLELYYLATLVTICLVVIHNVLVLAVNKLGKSKREVPKWLKGIIHNKWFRIRGNTCTFMAHNTPRYPTRYNRANNKQQVLPNDKNLQLDGIIHRMDSMYASVTSFLEKKEKQGQRESDWYTVAVWMDRLAMVFFPLLLLICYKVSSSLFYIPASLEETSIMQSILHEYDTKSRPELDKERITVVSMMVDIYRIIHLDEKLQQLSTHFVCYQTWVDERLRWDPANYNEKKHVRLPASNIWIPTTILYNALENQELFDVNKNVVTVYHNGTVTVYWKPVVSTTTCPACELIFRPWSYMKDEVLLIPLPEELDRRKFQTVVGGEWTLEDGQVRVVIGIAATTLSFLSFLIPYEYGNAKMSMNVTLVLLIIVFLDMVGERLPATSSQLPSLGLVPPHLSEGMSVCGKDEHEHERTKEIDIIGC
ncbi:5-hydroxytryptamine receptor 3A-like [Glandiceps talaboti]